MPEWMRSRWRWSLAISATAAVLLAVLFSLVDQGLRGAADAVQALSAMSLIGGIFAWARVRGQGPAAGTGQVELSVLLRTVVEAHGLGYRAVKAALPGWDVDAYLDGTLAPGWDFVSAFLDVIAGGDRARRGALERRIRPVWAADAARRSGRDAAMPVPAGTSAWLAASQQAATATQVAGQAQESASKIDSWRSALVTTLKQYSEAVTMLAAERDELAGQLVLMQEQEIRAETLTVELADVRQRLDDAERLREQTRLRLERAERRLGVAERLRDEAVAQAALFRARLAELEGRPAPRAAVAAPGTAVSDPGKLMGDTDRLLGAEIIRRADDFLREQDAALGLQAAAIGQLRPAATRTPARPPGRRKLAGLIVVISAVTLVPLALSGGRAGYVQLESPRYQPLAVAWSPDGKTLAVASGDTIAVNGVTYLWDVATRELAGTLRDPKGLAEDSVAFSPDGKLLAVGDDDGKTYLWSVATRRVVAVLPDPTGFSVNSVAFGPGGRTLAEGDGNGETYVWDVATRTSVAVFRDPGPGDVIAVALGPGGKTLAAGDFNGGTFLWDVATRKPAATFAAPLHVGVQSVAFSPDGRELAAGNDAGSTYVWGVASGRLIGMYSDPGGGRVDSVGFGRGGTTLATGDSSGTTYLWDTGTRERVATFPDPGGADVLAVAFSPDGKTLAVGDDDGSTYLWPVPSLKVADGTAREDSRSSPGTAG